MKLWKRWKRWRRRSRKLTVTEKEIRQVHRLKTEVAHTILAEVGEPILTAVLDELRKNRKEKGESDYTSLAEIWLLARERSENLRRDQ